MSKQTFHLACSVCGQERLVPLMATNYSCNSCHSPLRINGRGTAIIEWIVITPLFLVVYWGIADALMKHGVHETSSTYLGMLCSAIVSLPACCALRPHLVTVELEEQRGT